MSPVLSIKSTIGPYRIEEFSANTPLGELYRVTDERNNKFLALTLLHKSIAENGEVLKELEANAPRLQALNQPHLNKYLGIFKTPTQAYLLEEWVDGPSLRKISERSKLNAEEILFLAYSIGNALETLHKNHYLHLNLCPELIRINKQGQVVVSGIGGAKASHKIVKPRLGKYRPLYIAPEYIREEALSPAADIYMLAVILYELTTGCWLNGSKTAPRTLDLIRQTHLEQNPPAPNTLNPNLPDNFSRMLQWALRKDPNERLKNATELTSALAMAAGLTLDKVPLQATSQIAPVITALIHAWEFLPPPVLTSVSADAIPLEERLAAISGPKKKTPPRAKFMPYVLLVLLIGVGSLLLYTRPQESMTLISLPLSTSQANISPIIESTPEPSATPQARPTLGNGGRIVFTCTRGDFNQLCMINPDGTELTQLTSLEASHYYPVSVPDTSGVLFASNRAGTNFDFFILNFAQRDIFQLTVNIGNVISPDFSPDGRNIVFANRTGNNPTAIWMVNTDGLNPRLVYTGAGDIVSVAWSPNGEKIAYAMNMGVPQEYEIFSMDTNGRNHLRISEGLKGIGGSVDWSPDGNSLLVHAGPFGDKDIFKINVNTGDFLQITFGGNNAGATYSPDGKHIIFNSMRNNEQADLYIMDQDGSGLQQITNHPEPDWGATWVK